MRQVHLISPQQFEKSHHIAFKDHATSVNPGNEDYPPTLSCSSSGRNDQIGSQRSHLDAAVTNSVSRVFSKPQGAADIFQQGVGSMHSQHNKTSDFLINSFRQINCDSPPSVPKSPVSSREVLAFMDKCKEPELHFGHGDTEAESHPKASRANFPTKVLGE